MSSKVGGIIKGIYPDSKVIYIKRFDRGVINETYDVKVDDRALVLRIYPKDFWKIKKERYLYGLLSRKVGIPVPRVLKSGRNYMLMTKVEGKELSRRDNVLVKKAGEILAKIHSIKFPYYGWIINKEVKPRFKRWADFIDYDVKLKFSKIPGKYSDLKKRVKKIVDEDRGLLDINSAPCLLHKDYHSSHIIVGNGRINGIIDWEWAMSGHNEFDIVKSCLWMFDRRPKQEKIFLDGYRKIGKISREFNEREGLYRVIHLLSSFSLSHECRDRKRCVYNLNELEEEIDEYN